MNAFFGGLEQQQQQQPPGDDANPFSNFWRSVTGQAGMDAATAAAAQFGEFMNQQQQQWADHQQQPAPAGPPPASRAALRQLPTISVTAEDLVEPSNRECCICFEENNIHDKVVRLPCAHIYHPQCIHDWLERHCTCPTCRFELPTEDPMYEAGRRQRMRSRKPRFAKYELERMPIRELKDLLPRRQRSASGMFSDKTDLIDYLISNEIVDLINTPPPVEFPNMAVLRAMGVGALKRTMNETGVFFDPRDVVEKEDMVQIFVNSGRICLTEPEPNATGPDTTYGHAPVRRSYSFGSSCSQLDDSSETNHEDGDGQTANNNSRQQQFQEQQDDTPVVVETVRENDDGGTSPYASRETMPEPIWESEMIMEETDFVEVEDGDDGPEIVSSDSTGGASRQQDPRTSAEERSTVSNTDADTSPAAAAASANTTGEEDDDCEWIDESLVDESFVERKRQREEEEEERAQRNREADQFARLSIGELRSLGRQNGVDLTHCIERGEMIERLSSRGSSSHSRRQPSTTNGGSRSHEKSANLAIAADTIQSWTMSQLQTCGIAVDMDLSHCTSREDMIQLLLGAGEERPRVVKIVLALAPLMGMSTSQLRAQAREWNVPVNDCLEKGEIIRRLSATAAQRALRNVS